MLKDNQTIENSSNNSSSHLGSTILVANVNGINNQGSSIRPNQLNSKERANSNETRLVTSTRKTPGLFDKIKERGIQGESLYREALTSCGATEGTIDNFIKQFQDSWRRHKQGLGYAQLTPAAILNAKRAFSTLLIAVGHNSNIIYNHTTSLSVRQERLKTKKEVKQISTYNVDDVLNHIRKRSQIIDILNEDEIQGIVLALIMVITTRRMAEIHRSTMDPSTLSEDQFQLHTWIRKVGGGPVTISFQKAADQQVCPVRWFNKWWLIQQPRSNKGQILWWNSYKQHNASPDLCSKLTKAIIKAAGINTKSRITELRAASITKVIDKGAPMAIKSDGQADYNEEDEVDSIAYEQKQLIDELDQYKSNKEGRVDYSKAV
ncbi:MAG: hypothetical protein EZS28_005920 [Streblomastix strix]|uniref:Tyr recombinase domain-containing protein n=1 Tax=Streblomastix strix TaxID=222440 RepID=A0A5J4WUB3_9EUKA|nr:MAG: hypothetical protein EZS28_005920 [Streblomastix strix]